MCVFYSTMLCHFIVCISLYRTVKLHLYVCSYYGLHVSNLIKETTYLLFTFAKQKPKLSQRR